MGTDFGMIGIDKAVIASRFGKNTDSYEQNACVQKNIATHLMKLIKTYCRGDMGRILEIGCGTGFLTGYLREQWKQEELWVNDLVESMCRKAATKCGILSSQCLVGDIETIDLPGLFSLITSSSVFQWLAHPADTFIRLASHINSEGWLAFSTFGEDNCIELKTLTGEGLNYLSIEELHDLLSPFFEIIYTEEDTHTLFFSTPSEVLRHIKNTGVNALPVHKIWTKGRLRDFEEDYTRLFLTDTGYPLTYHPRYLICRKRK